jgi:hypothetical protein
MNKQIINLIHLSFAVKMQFGKVKYFTTLNFERIKNYVVFPQEDFLFTKTIRKNRTNLPNICKNTFSDTTCFRATQQIPASFSETTQFFLIQLYVLTLLRPNQEI